MKLEETLGSVVGNIVLLGQQLSSFIPAVSVFTWLGSVSSLSEERKSKAKMQ